VQEFAGRTFKVRRSTVADEHKPEKAMAGMLKRQNVWPAVSGEACPDASRLAAYFERTLTAPETAQCEAHFSVCARCQEQLAAMMRAEPASAAKPSEDRKSALHWVWNWRWLAPVGAAVVVLAFIVSYKALQAPVESPTSSVLMAKRDATTAAPQAAKVTSAEKSENAATASKPKSPAPPIQDKGKVAGDEKKLKKEMASGSAGRTEPGVKDKNAFAIGGGAVGGMAGAIAGPAEPQRNIPAMENRVVVAQSDIAKSQIRANEMDRAQAPQANAPPETAKKQGEQVTVEAGARAMSAPATSQLPANKRAVLHKEEAADQKSAADAVQKLRAAPQARLDLRAAPEELVISTPKTGVLWRFKDFVRIERTQDGGKTWTAQENPTKESILTAVAPSESVCWAGGSNGVLLRTTDGGDTWELMPSPTKRAIVSLTSTDQLSVIVTSADGHKFETRDAGLHWRAL
jgi:photosynthesis system II assembly factor YCF48-like protein